MELIVLEFLNPGLDCSWFLLDFSLNMIQMSLRFVGLIKVFDNFPLNLLVYIIPLSLFEFPCMSSCILTQTSFGSIFRLLVAFHSSFLWLLSVWYLLFHLLLTAKGFLSEWCDIQTRTVDWAEINMFLPTSPVQPIPDFQKNVGCWLWHQKSHQVTKVD